MSKAPAAPPSRARARRHDRLLRHVADRVRAMREARGFSRPELARRSGVSLRFLAQLEAGEGNISVLRLDDVAAALGVGPAELVDAPDEGSPRAALSRLLEERSEAELREIAALLEARYAPGSARTAATGHDGEAAGRRHVALLGVRGAGKSTVGRRLAARLGRPFHELDQLIERAAGLPLSQIFDLHGEAYYRRLEREVLAAHLLAAPASVLATGGSLVTDEATYSLLRERTTTIWLRARAEDHWNRVVAQGDRRPMEKHPHAMQELRTLLAARAPLYAQAEHVVETTGVEVDAVVERALARLS